MTTKRRLGQAVHGILADHGIGKSVPPPPILAWEEGGLAGVVPSRRSASRSLVIDQVEALSALALAAKNGPSVQQGVCVLTPKRWKPIHGLPVRSGGKKKTGLAPGDGYSVVGVGFGTLR